MIQEHTEHWPLTPARDDLSEDEAARLLEAIRERAHLIHEKLVSEGRDQSPQDDWLAAEAEVLNEERPLAAAWRRRNGNHH